MRSFQSVENKIKESDFFLRCLEVTKGPEIIYYLSAYLSAARSITFAMQVAMKLLTLKNGINCNSKSLKKIR